MMPTFVLAAAEMLLFCLGAPVVVGVIIAIGVAAYRAEQRRKEALRAFAREHGLTLDEQEDASWDRQWPRFECFQRGHSRRAFNLMSGQVDGTGPSCILGEYLFKETHGSGKNRRTVTYRFGFVIVRVGAIALPDVLIRREHLFDKIAGFFGFDDIDFESAEFSKRFMVKSADKRFAYDLIDAQMMEFLLKEGTPNVDLGGNAFCLWYGQSNRLEPMELLSLARWGAAFLERWPRIVRAALDEARPTSEDRRS